MNAVVSVVGVISRFTRTLLDVSVDVGNAIAFRQPVPDLRNAPDRPQIGVRRIRRRWRDPLNRLSP